MQKKQTSQCKKNNEWFTSFCVLALHMPINWGNLMWTISLCFTQGTNIQFLQCSDFIAFFDAHYS